MPKMWYEVWTSMNKLTKEKLYTIIFLYVGFISLMIGLVVDYLLLGLLGATLLIISIIYAVYLVSEMKKQKEENMERKLKWV